MGQGTAPSCVCGTVRPLQLALTKARGISLISNLEDRELSVFLLLLALKMKTKHSFIHHPREQEHPVDFFLFGTRPSSSWRATAIFALRSFHQNANRGLPGKPVP
jgi:hypothetical protein